MKKYLKTSKHIASLFTEEEWNLMCQKVPKLKRRYSSKIEDTLIVLGSLQFPDLKVFLLENPELLLEDAYKLSEQIQEQLRKEYDMEPIRASLVKPR